MTIRTLTPLIVLACLTLAAAPRGDEILKEESLAAHNKYRKELNIEPLTWNETLAEHAQQWADNLAKRRRMYHSSNDSRKGEGENLWMGTRGYYSYTQMDDSWGSEKKYFKEGTFPDVSTSGSWQDVGHYTQMIWAKTKEVGCAIASSSEYDFFVCRYSPPGNYVNQEIY
ncbi:MAG: CAP family protein [Spirochaetota bacterium]